MFQHEKYRRIYQKTFNSRNIKLIFKFILKANKKGEIDMIKPAIVAVGYNRPDGMRRLLESIGKAKYNTSDIPLIVSIDESDKSDEVEKVAREFEWKYGPLEIRRFPKRQGLRKHIIQCGDYSLVYGGVIILEDDLVVSEDFYTYTCKAHEVYGEDERICGVSLYSYGVNVFTRFEFCPAPSVEDVFLGDMVVTWGQSWNKRQWSAFKEWYVENEGKLPLVNPKMPKDISGWTRSWGRYFASYIVDKGVSYIYPYRARTTCFSDFGEHNKSRVPLTFVQVPLMQGTPDNYKMGEIDQLVHYDIFYERVLDNNQLICGIRASEICMDLNNTKTIAQGKNYVITNSVLPFEKITSFGLTLRPICLNVLQEIPGDQLHLYKLENDIIRQWDRKKTKLFSNRRRLRYEFGDISWRSAFYYAVVEVFGRIRDILFRIR